MVGTTVRCDAGSRKPPANFVGRQDLHLGHHLAKIATMTTYSVAQAKDNLSELIDRAMRGEPVVVTRYGTPVVELKPFNQVAEPISETALNWLAARRVEPTRPIHEDAGSLMSRLRDEDDV